MKRPERLTLCQEADRPKPDRSFLCEKIKRDFFRFFAFLNKNEAFMRF